MSGDLVKLNTASAALYRSYLRALLPKKARPEQALLMPSLQLQTPPLASSLLQLQQYRQLCGIADDGLLPLCWPNILSFPLQLALLTARQLPLPVMGMLHLSNQIRQLQPIPEHAALSFEVCLLPPRQDRKGLVLQLQTSAYHDGVLCWQQQAEHLYRLGPTPATTAPRTGALPVVPEVTEPLPLAPLTLTTADSRRYARLSGDLNPIHLSGWTGRCFGLPAAIAHGMHLKAACLARLTSAQSPCQVQVRFHKPLLLPGQASILQLPVSEPGQHYQLLQRQQDKVLLSASILPI